MREDLIPLMYCEKSTQKIQTGNGENLNVHYKILEVHICIKKTYVKTSFLLVKTLKQGVILENFFLTQIKSFIVINGGISTLIKGKNILFKFCSEPKESFLDLLKGSTKIEIVNALANNFSLNDRIKEEPSTSEKKDLKLLHSPFYFNRNMKENTYPV